MTEPALKEPLEPWNSGDRRDQQESGPEEKEPLIVVDRLGFEVAEEIPSVVSTEVLNVLRANRDAAKVETDDQQVVVNHRLHTIQAGEPVGEVVMGGEKVQIGKHHACHEQRTVPSIDNVQKVKDQAGLAPESGIAACTREGEQGSVNDDRPLELERDRPEMEVVTQPRLVALVEDEAEGLDFSVPRHDLRAVSRFRF